MFLKVSDVWTPLSLYGGKNIFFASLKKKVRQLWMAWGWAHKLFHFSFLRWSVPLRLDRNVYFSQFFSFILTFLKTVSKAKYVVVLISAPSLCLFDLSDNILREIRVGGSNTVAWHHIQKWKSFIYSPSCRSKPVWFSASGEQRRTYFEELFELFFCP